MDRRRNAQAGCVLYQGPILKGFTFGSQSKQLPIRAMFLPRFKTLKLDFQPVIAPPEGKPSGAARDGKSLAK
jgi:hypothetical protein